MVRPSEATTRSAPRPSAPGPSCSSRWDGRAEVSSVSAVPDAHNPITVDVRVIPRAKKNEVGGERAGRLVVRTSAAPVDGKANVAVCKLIAAHFGVPARSVEVVAGERSRDKTLRITR